MISPIVDTATGTVKVTIEALDPPEEGAVREASSSVDIVRDHARSTRWSFPARQSFASSRAAHVFVVTGRRGSRNERDRASDSKRKPKFVEILTGISEKVRA